MNKVNRVKSKLLFPIIIEILQNNQKAKLTVTGSSMSPFLKNQRDCVELAKTSFYEIHRGDIVLIKRIDGHYVLHRVYKKEEDCFYIIGDAQQWIEGPLKPDQLIAIVTRVWRNQKEISCNHFLWRFLSLTWLRLRIFRYIIKKTYFKIKQLKKKISWGTHIF